MSDARLGCRAAPRNLGHARPARRSLAERVRDMLVRAMRFLRPLVPCALVPLAGCAMPVAAPPPPAVAASPPPVAQVGLERVMGREAAAVIALLGTPALDLREGPARKLQFRGAACVLDAYLYPPVEGGPARVTYLDARTPQGGDLDRASCIAALVRR